MGLNGRGSERQDIFWHHFKLVLISRIKCIQWRRLHHHIGYHTYVPSRVYDRREEKTFFFFLRSFVRLSSHFFFRFCFIFVAFNFFLFRFANRHSERGRRRREKTRWTNVNVQVFRSGFFVLSRQLGWVDGPGNIRFKFHSHKIYDSLIWFVIAVYCYCYYNSVVLAFDLMSSLDSMCCLHAHHAYYLRWRLGHSATQRSQFIWVLAARANPETIDKLFLPFLLTTTAIIHRICTVCILDDRK